MPAYYVELHFRVSAHSRASTRRTMPREHLSITADSLQNPCPSVAAVYFLNLPQKLHPLACLPHHDHQECGQSRRGSCFCRVGAGRGRRPALLLGCELLGLDLLRARVGSRPAQDVLVHQLANRGERERDANVGPQEVALGAHVGHHLCPFGHHGVALHLHLVGAGVQQDWELVHQSAGSAGHAEIVAKGFHPLLMVGRCGGRAEVAGVCHVRDGLRRRFRSHHASVDTLPGDGVNVPSGIATDHDVVAVRGLEPLAAKAQRGGAHAPNLGIGPKSL
mmetsp:Transcript_31591/g.81729  ORF Transcript_31591/g.81729 Transcript_31591/m.81729 type:complete len:277 (-) Transcript_31591:1069-1899(-)